MQFLLFYLESYAVNIPWAPGPLLRVTPGWESCHHYLEMHVSGPWVLHDDIPEAVFSTLIGRGMSALIGREVLSVAGASSLMP